MPPLPKRKTPNTKKGKRRSHLRMKLPHVVQGPSWCPFGPGNCQGPRISHTACTTCGMYRGRQVLPIDRDDLDD